MAFNLMGFEYIIDQAMLFLKILIHHHTFSYIHKYNNHKQVFIYSDFKIIKRLQRRICLVNVSTNITLTMNDGCLVMAPICRQREETKAPLTILKVLWFRIVHL